MFWYIILCREFYADHFSSFCFLVSSTNGGGKVKILKTIKWFWPTFFSSFFSLFWPYHRYLLMKVEIFFHQNDQQDELYKLEYAKKKMTKFCFFKRWIVMWIKSITITQNGYIRAMCGIVSFVARNLLYKTLYVTFQTRCKNRA